MASTIKIVNKTPTIKVVQKTPKISIRSSGPRGLRGEGLPANGQDGQYLVKNTDAPFAYRWEYGTLGDSNYTTEFITTSTVDVYHNLNKYPSVTVMDSAGDEIVGEVQYINTSQLVVLFSAPFSGRVTCN